MKKDEKRVLILWIILYLIFFVFTGLKGISKLDLGISDGVFISIYSVIILLLIVCTFWIFRNDSRSRAKLKSLGLLISTQLYFVYIGLEWYLEKILPGKMLSVIQGIITALILIFSILELKRYFDNKNKQK